MTNEKEKYWFRAKKVGWGWGLPCAWQGWVMMIGFLVIITVSAIEMAPNNLPAWIGLNVILCVALIAICWAKGERPGGRH